MGSLTKADMAERLSSEQKLSKRDAKEMVEAFFDEVSSSLINNEQVKLSGFGNFDCETSDRDLGAILKRVKKWLFQRVGW